MNTVKCSNRSCDKEYSVQFDKCPICGTPNPIEESERKAMIDSSTVINGSNGSGDDDKFNGWVTGILWISIIYGGIRGFINCLTYFTISPVIGCLITGIHIFGIVVLCFILAAKKWAVFAWIGYIAAVVVCNGYFDNNDYLPYVAVGIFKLVFIFLVLQIKKNGVSAWSVIFNKQKSPNKKKETKIKKTKSGKSIFKRTPLYKKADNKKTFEPNNRIIKDDKTQISVRKVITDDIPPVSNNESEPIETTPAIIQSDKQSIEESTYTSEKKAENNRVLIHDKKNPKTCLKNCKWWIYLLIVITILAIVWLVVFLVHHSSKSELGEYVYVDDYNILHTDRNCEHIANIHGAKPITIYSLHEIEGDKWNHVCSKCVNDNNYKKIENHVIGNENLKAIYNILKTEDYTPPAFKQFVKDMQEDSNLRGVYATLQKEGYITPPFSDFIANLGGDKNRPPSRAVNYEKCNLRILYDALKKGGVVTKSYEYFYDYLQNENNRQLLYKSLKADNWDVPDSYENFRFTLFETDTLSENNFHDRKWLYNKMQAAGIETGSFEYFKYSLSNKEDLSWYYDKCQELGLDVGSYTEFVKQYAL